MNERKYYMDVVKKFNKKLKKIKVFITDVDGILTDGKIHWDGHDIGFNRSFHALDGYGMKILKQAGIKIGLITGGDSNSVKVRAEYLKMDYIFVGTEDKRHALDKILSDGFKEEEILYMGDEFFDLPILMRVGFSATVPNASWEIKKEVDYITRAQSGEGCVREVIDLVRYAQKIVPKIEGYNA